MANKRIEFILKKPYGEGPAFVDSYHISYNQEGDIPLYVARLFSQPRDGLYQGDRVVTSQQNANKALSNMLEAIREKYPVGEYKEILSDMSDI